MSIGENGWSEVERRARQHEVSQLYDLADIQESLVTITVEDRLRGAVVEALSLLEQGSPTAAHQVLQDALKIKGDLR